jgi:hypothetical protein
MLKVFLNKLRNTQDFKNSATRSNVIALINQILKDACTHNLFQEKLFLLLHDANDTCHDRTAITFGRIELEWRFLCDPNNADAKSLAKLIIGYERLELLNGIADRKIAEKRLGDAIETKLFYQTRLKEALELPISTSDMLYGRMSGITDEELADATFEIFEKTGSIDAQVRILLSSERGSEAWENLLKEKHGEDFGKISDFYTGQLNDLDPNMPSGEYQKQTNQIAEAQKQKTAELMQKLTRTYLEA